MCKRLRPELLTTLYEDWSPGHFVQKQFPFNDGAPRFFSS